MASLSNTLINPYLQSFSTEYTETARLKDDLKRLIVANALLNNIADGCVAPYVSVENPLYMYEFYKVVDNRDRDISTQYDSIVDSNAQTMEKIFSEELLGQKEDKQLRKYYIKLRNQSISTDRLIEKNKELADELNNTDYFDIELLNRLFSSFWDQAAKNLQDDFDKSKANKGKKAKRKIEKVSVKIKKPITD